MRNLFKKGFFILLAMTMTVACSSDNDNNGGGSSDITGLDFTISTKNTDGNEVGVTPTSNGATLYTVLFGDTSVNDDSDIKQTSGPEVTYTYPSVSGVYTITVVATNSSGAEVSESKTHTVNIEVVTPTSDLVGTWKLAPEAGALGVGPGLNDIGWWSNSTEDVAGRACLFDDEYVFGADGSFTNVVGNETWIEAWQGGDGEACGTPVFPHDGTATATYMHDASAGTIKIDGQGAYLGLAKVYNGGELASPSSAALDITYIATLSEDKNTLELDIEVGDGGHWSFKLVRDGTSTGGGGGSAASVVGTWQLTPEAGALGVGPGLNDIGWWSNSTEDVVGRACLFDDEYVFGADGSFTNVVGNETWIEAWQGGDGEACGTPVFPHNGTASATYVHDASAGTIKIDGQGAYLGLAKVYNGGELASPSSAALDITYIASMSEDGDTLELDIEVADGGHWSFKLSRKN
jgi:hypothetical protein